MPASRVSLISGWTITLEDHTYVATRLAGLTDYQRQWGAVAELDARTEGELWLLCDAQTRLAERLAVAEATRPKVKPHPKVLARRARTGGHA
ncbi:hypothetical protein ACQPZ8_05680 [Actinomadura nitritigenes]|uniref:hypothetical protein n=1 Tax=Actinomadura nitritigenes TaxID=134602 RepID=UPI003D8C784F